MFGREKKYPMGVSSGDFVAFNGEWKKTSLGHYIRSEKELHELWETLPPLTAEEKLWIKRKERL